MSESRPPVKVVFWDFHGTLAHAPEEWSVAMVELLDEALPDHGIDRATMFGCIQEGFPWHTPEIAHTHLRTADQWWDELEPALARGYGRAGLDDPLARDLARGVRARYLQPHRYRVDPGARDALRTVAAAGWSNVVLSNHVPELEQILADVGLRDLIDTMYTSARTGYEKPHRLAFLAPYRDLGEPAPVWMVGDNPATDVRGAEAAGIPAIQVGDAPGDSPRSVADLAAAAELIVTQSPPPPGVAAELLP